MKKSNKALAIIMALVMILSTAATALAKEIPSNEVRLPVIHVRPAEEEPAEEPVEEQPEAEQPEEEAPAEEPAEEQPEEEVPAEEPAAQEAPAEIDYSILKISFTSNYNNADVEEGTVITLTAHVSGFDEQGLSYTVYWQHSVDGGSWVTAGSGMTYSFAAAPENEGWLWRPAVALND